MLRATRIRLWLDLSVQLLLFILFGVQIYLHPNADALLFYSSLFAILISAWQILLAFYLVKKYKDWQRQQYLYSMRQVLGYGLLTLGVGVFMLVTSFGFLFPFFYFTILMLHWTLVAVVLLLSINYFIISFRRLYEYLYRPKSFWDL